MLEAPQKVVLFKIPCLFILGETSNIQDYQGTLLKGVSYGE
jgi:hypothetical protein